MWNEHTTLTNISTQTLDKLTKGNNMTFENDGNTKFFIDDEAVTCEVFNTYFDRHDTGWQEEVDAYGTLHLTIFTDDTRS
jgi:hypothetical protein